MRKNHFGFTLPELLIALAILGVIATFAIPKILLSEQDRKKIAIFKESIAMVEAIYYNSGLTGNLDATNIGSSVINNINAVKVCNSNSETQGCWTAPSLGSLS
jgi:prepilin-type N-terminal cleavage/methylation domain-containing protein